MKQTIPFKKDITFKTKIGEITSISLENDLILKGEDLISGNFYISGTYKMLEASTIEESYSYKIPCEIAISDDYDTFDATIDIDDFHYEIIDEEILRVSIVVELSNLNKKEKDIIIESEEVISAKEEENDIEVLEERCYEDESDKTKTFLEVKEQVKKQTDNYLTYKVYIYKEGDTIDKIIDTYKTSKDDLALYNNLDDITVGSKIVIPSMNND